jgi:MFS family permease
MFFLLQWQLVCERRFLRPLIATLYFCGVTIGAVICGLLADRYGRRPLILICLYAQGLAGVSLYFIQSLAAFMALRFIQGFFVQVRNQNGSVWVFRVVRSWFIS